MPDPRASPQQRPLETPGWVGLFPFGVFKLGWIVALGCLSPPSQRARDSPLCFLDPWRVTLRTKASPALGKSEAAAQQKMGVPQKGSIWALVYLAVGVLLSEVVRG